VRLLRLTPRDAVFGELYTASATELVDAARLLAEMLGADDADLPVLRKEMAEVERRSADCTNALLRRLDGALVVPFDRGDVYALAVALADCAERMASSLEQYVLHEPLQLPVAAEDLVRALSRAADVTVTAVGDLRPGRRLTDHCLELARLRRQSAHVRRLVLRDLRSDGAELLPALRTADVVTELDGAAQAFRDVGRTIEVIALKEH
jgi:uncharacterized protein